jgi:hypothetical protein
MLVPVFIYPVVSNGLRWGEYQVTVHTVRPLGEYYGSGGSFEDERGFVGAGQG